MFWLNLVGTLAIGAVVVLAMISVFDIVFRAPRAKRQPGETSAGDRHPAASGAKAAPQRGFKR